MMKKYNLMGLGYRNFLKVEDKRISYYLLVTY